MATWHQLRNVEGIRAMYAPDLLKWKVVSNKPGEPAFVQLFSNRSDALKFYDTHGGTVVAPAQEKKDENNA